MRFILTMASFAALIFPAALLFAAIGGGFNTHLNVYFGGDEQAYLLDTFEHHATCVELRDIMQARYAENLIRVECDFTPGEPLSLDAAIEGVEA